MGYCEKVVGIPGQDAPKHGARQNWQSNVIKSLGKIFAVNIVGLTL